MKDHIFIVTVTCETEEQAEQVMIERLGFDEDYGFDYTVDFRRAGTVPTHDKYAIVNISDHGGYDMEESWVESMRPNEDGWGPFDTLEEANAAMLKLNDEWPTWVDDFGHRRKCDGDLEIITLKSVP